jgi:hypothetical protein
MQRRQWYRAHLRWALMAEKEGLRGWSDSIHLFRSQGREAAFQHALELGRRLKSGHKQGHRNARWVETRFAEVMSLDCLGANLRDDVEVHWGSSKPTEPLAFEQEFHPESRSPRRHSECRILDDSVLRSALIARAGLPLRPGPSRRNQSDRPLGQERAKLS